MNVTAILEIISKVVVVANTLIQAGQSAEPAIRALSDFMRTQYRGIARGVPPSDDDIKKMDATLDALIAQFNEELPKE